MFCCSKLKDDSRRTHISVSLFRQFAASLRELGDSRHCVSGSANGLSHCFGLVMNMGTSKPTHYIAWLNLGKENVLNLNGLTCFVPCTHLHGDAPAGNSDCGGDSGHGSFRWHTVVSRHPGGAGHRVQVRDPFCLLLAHGPFD